MHVFGQSLQLEDWRASYFRSLIRAVFAKTSFNTRNYIIWSAILLTFLVAITANYLHGQQATDQFELNSTPVTQLESLPQIITDQQKSLIDEGNVSASQSPSQQSVSTKVETISTGNSTSVKVNDQPVPVPPNGNISKQITSNDGQTSVNISVNNSSNNDNSYTEVQVDSSSTESTNFEDVP